MHRPRLPGTIDLETPGHFLEPLHQHGDRDGPIVGYIEHHPDPRLGRQGRDCYRYLPIVPGDAGRDVYTVEAGAPETPETLSPSILCRTCGAHFWIRDRRAVLA